MKNLLIIIAVLIATPAFAQSDPRQHPLSAKQIQEQYLVETGQLRQALGQTMSRLDAANARISALEKQVASQPKKTAAKPPALPPRDAAGHPVPLIMQQPKPQSKAK